MTINRKLYINNPLHLYSSNLEKDVLSVVIINKDKKYINRISFDYFNEKIDIDVFSSCEEIELKFKISNMYFLGEPIIVSAVIENEEIIFEYNDCVYIKDSKEISKNDLKTIKDELKSIGYIDNQISYYPFKKDNYWKCACGKLVLSDKCPNCKFEKETLFKDKDNYEPNKKAKKISIKDTTRFVWIALLLFIHLYVINLIIGGDLLYKNGDMSSFFSLVNRFVIPSIILICVGITSFAPFENKKIKYSLWMIEGVCLLYLNITQFVSLANVSYNVFITIGYDVVYATYGLITIRNKKKFDYKYIISGLLISSILYSFICVGTLTKYKFTVEKNSVCLRVNSKDKIVNIPNRIDNLPVKKIIFEADKNYQMEELILPKNIEEIYGFKPKNCSRLKRAIIDEKNTFFSLENNVIYSNKSREIAFFLTDTDRLYIDCPKVKSYCFAEWESAYKKEIVISKKVVKIDEYAFYKNNAFNALRFENNSSIEEIGEYAFSECYGVNEMIVPDSIKSLGLGCFYNSGFKRLNVPFIGAKDYEELDVMNKNTFDYLYAHDAMTSKLDKLVVTNQKYVQDSAFYKAAIGEIELHGCVGTIGRNAFKYCTATKIVIPEGIVELDEESFAYCMNLKEIVLPSTLKKIGKNAFKESNCIEIFDISKVDVDNLTINDGNDTILKFMNQL